MKTAAGRSNGEEKPARSMATRGLVTRTNKSPRVLSCPASTPWLFAAQRPPPESVPKTVIKDMYAWECLQ